MIVDDNKSSGEDGAKGSPRSSKTPLYQAIHGPRYERQNLIREIEAETGSKLLCYVAGDMAPVHREDVVGFVDLLHNIGVGEPIDLLLHTGGGDIDAAEKLVSIMRKKAGKARVRLVVPDYAKSAGTLIALGMDSIVMSDTSELGPIDPQIIRRDHNGNLAWQSVLNYLDAYETHAKRLREAPDDMPAKIMLDKLEPEMVTYLRSIMARARQVAEVHLKRGMMLDTNGNWSKTVSTLLDGKRFKSHGQPISWEDASDPEIGLTVEYLTPDSELWLKVWRLYCLQRLSVKDNQKLFESNIASLCIDSSAG